MTNVITAVNLATVELFGTHTAQSERGTGSNKVTMLFIGGQLTLPIDSSTTQNMQMAIQQAARASKLNVRIDTFAIGEEALSEPKAAVEMARVSNGTFTPVRNPGDLRAVLDDVSFAEIGELEVRNQTNGAVAEQVVRGRDGSYAALLPMDEGKNTVEVVARSGETQANQQICVAPDPHVMQSTIGQDQLLRLLFTC